MQIANKLKVDTWNANSLKFKLNEFKHFLFSRDHDIVGICETKIDTNDKLHIPGYCCYVSNRNRRGGGVALVVKKELEHFFVNIQNFKGI